MKTIKLIRCITGNMLIGMFGILLATSCNHFRDQKNGMNTDSTTLVGQQTISRNSINCSKSKNSKFNYSSQIFAIRMLNERMLYIIKNNIERYDEEHSIETYKSILEFAQIKADKTLWADLKEMIAKLKNNKSVEKFRKNLKGLQLEKLLYPFFETNHPSFKCTTANNILFKEFVKTLLQKLGSVSLLESMSEDIFKNLTRFVNDSDDPTNYVALLSLLLHRFKSMKDPNSTEFEPLIVSFTNRTPKGIGFWRMLTDTLPDQNYALLDQIIKLQKLDLLGFKKPIFNKLPELLIDHLDIFWKAFTSLRKGGYSEELCKMICNKCNNYDPALLTFLMKCSYDSNSIEKYVKRQVHSLLNLPNRAAFFHMLKQLMSNKYSYIANRIAVDYKYKIIKGNCITEYLLPDIEEFKVLLTDIQKCDFVEDVMKNNPRTKTGNEILGGLFYEYDSYPLNLKILRPILSGLLLSCKNLNGDLVQTLLERKIKKFDNTLYKEIKKGIDNNSKKGGSFFGFLGISNINSIGNPYLDDESSLI